MFHFLCPVADCLFTAFASSLPHTAYILPSGARTQRSHYSFAYTPLAVCTKQLSSLINCFYEVVRESFYTRDSKMLIYFSVGCIKQRAIKSLCTWSYNAACLSPHLPHSAIRPIKQCTARIWLDANGCIYVFAHHRVIRATAESGSRLLVNAHQIYL